MKLSEVKKFLDSLYYKNRTNKIPMEVTDCFRQRVKRYINFVKKENQKNWDGLKIINNNKERKLNRLEEQLSRLC